MTNVTRAILLILALTTFGAEGRAQKAPGSVTILVGFGAGQGTDLAMGDTSGMVGARLTAEPSYDQAARFYASEYGRFLPGRPSLGVKLTPGAASLIAASLLAHGPTDGSLLAMLGPAVLLEPILTGKPVAQPVWIGARQRDDDVCIVRSDTGLNSIEDLRRRRTFLAALSPTSRSYIYPRALNELYGAKIKIVSGYGSDFEIARAIETGEVEGWCGWSIQAIRARHADLLREGKVRVLVQFTRTPAGEGLQVPRASDLVTGGARDVMSVLASQTHFGAFALAAPAGISESVRATLRRAFMAMLRDPTTLDDAARQGLDVDPVGGEELEAESAEAGHLSSEARDLLRLVLRAP